VAGNICPYQLHRKCKYVDHSLKLASGQT
jgi:hypothetical protein